MSALAAEAVSKRFGGVTALDAASCSVEPGELVGLIGPNGSGKTTLLNILSGFYRPDSGRVLFAGRRVEGRDPAHLAEAGVARSFQVTKIFRRLSVLENLLVPGMLHWSVSRATAAEKAQAVLERIALDSLAATPAASLSGGQAKLLEFGRLMMLDPKVVLLDEPFGGVHPELKARMHETIRSWNGEGTSIILISHDMGSIFGLCRRILVLRDGRMIAEGDPEEIRRDPRVIGAYLGAAGVPAT